MSRLVKLTLSIPEPILVRAKRYSKLKGTSLSAMVTQLFKSFSQEHTNLNIKQSDIPITKSLIGILHLNPNQSDSDMISDAINAKFIKK